MNVQRAEVGQTLVEFALILPIMMLLLAGLFDLGHVVFVNNSLSDGARQGARKAATDPHANNYCSSVDQAVRTATLGQGLTAETVTYTTISIDGSAVNTYVICSAGSNGPDRAAFAADPIVGPGDQIRVNLSTRVELALGFVARAVGQGSFDLSAQSTMQVTFAP